MEDGGIWCYCTNCKLYHEHKEVLGLELKYGGRAKHKTMIAYEWCDHYQSELKGAGTYLCKFFVPAITRDEYKKIKGLENETNKQCFENKL